LQDAVCRWNLYTTKILLNAQNGLDNIYIERSSGIQELDDIAIEVLKDDGFDVVASKDIDNGRVVGYSIYWGR
jgi:hypothetical protein